MNQKIEVQARVRCRGTAEGMYDAWLSEEAARGWLAAALRSMGLVGDVRTVVTEARVGGRFLWSDQRGEVEARHWGTFLELDRGKRIVFTWIVDEQGEADPSKVTLVWSADEVGVVATIVHEMDAAWAQWADQTKQGWSRMMRAADEAGGN